MGTDKPDVTNLYFIFKKNYQSIFIVANIKNNSAISYCVSVFEKCYDIIRLIPNAFCYCLVPIYELLFCIQISLLFTKRLKVLLEIIRIYNTNIKFIFNIANAKIF